MNKDIRLPELDSLRGIAALMVVIFHFVLNLNIPSFYKIGTTGVDLFFIISGFVIFMSLQHTSNAIDFLFKRAIRLYPTYWIAVIFTFMLLAVSFKLRGNPLNIDLFYRFLANLTMFQYYLNVRNLDSPYWTLIIEALFYIVMAIMFRLKLLKHVNSILVPIIVVTIILKYTVDINGLIRGFPLLSFLPLFVAGINFYKIYIGDNKNDKLLILLICLMSQLLLFDVAGYSRYYIDFYEYAGMLTLFFIAFIMLTKKQLNFIVNPFAIYFGKISYALYVVHKYLSVKVLVPLLQTKFGINFWVASFLITLPAVILIASFITFYLEIPARRFLTKKKNAITYIR